MPQANHRSISRQLSLTLLFAFVLILYLIGHTSASSDDDYRFYHTRDGLHTCNFFDTVNITGEYQSLSNGSFVYEGTVIPAQLVGLYDYIYKDAITRVDAQPHYRACICKLRPCINLCCSWGTHFNVNSSSCQAKEHENHKWPKPVINITFGDGTELSMNITDHFQVQSYRPCEKMYLLIPELNEFDQYVIYENGTMYRADDGEYLNRNEYCLLPVEVNKTDEYYAIHPANCYKENEYSTVKIINAYAMIFSIPFMVLTILVYLCIPELRNQHGKSLVCYLLGLIIGYSMLVCISLSTDEAVPEPSCSIIGYTAYYFFMAAFFWLSVISFDLWHNFRGTRGANRFQEKKRFVIYSLYAWGLAAIFLVFTWYAQTQSNLPEYYKPGIGGTDFCWLDMRSWSAMIYFFGPILIIIFVNTIMFVMTAMKIHKVQREMARIMAREDSTRNLRTEKDKFGLFLRLFIVMGVTWSMEIISYFVGTDKLFAKLFYVSDICNAIQGFLIFILFVMKKKVKHLITNRYMSISGNSNQRQSQYSCKTTSSMMISNGNNSMGSNKEKPLMLEEQQQRTSYSTNLRD